MIVLTILFIIINIFLAKKDAKKIANSLIIDHTFNALFYAGLMAIILLPALFIFHLTTFKFILTICSVLLTRKIAFDIALNVFRGKAWNYVSTTTASVVDQLEDKIFKNNTTLMYAVYVALLIIINVI